MENGWTPTRIDMDEPIEVTDVKSAMETIFNLDEAYLWFKNAEGREHYIFFVRGNSPEELISDWNFSGNGSDSFGAIMDAFNPEDAI